MTVVTDVLVVLVVSDEDNVSKTESIINIRTDFMSILYREMSENYEVIYREK